MSNDLCTAPLRAQFHAQLHDLAKAEAERLRRAAADDFWRGANLLLDEALLRSQRSAQRLAHRLARHRLARLP